MYDRFFGKNIGAALKTLREWWNPLIMDVKDIKFVECTEEDYRRARIIARLIEQRPEIDSELANRVYDALYK